MAQAQDNIAQTFAEPLTSKRRVSMSGIWQIKQEEVEDADLAAVLAVALHRGLVRPADRKNLPIRNG